MKEELVKLNKKIDALVSLMILDKNLKTNEKVMFLSRLEFDNKEIANILGISESHVRKEKSLGRKNG